MKMRCLETLIATFCLVNIALSAFIVPCPEFCKCKTVKETLNAKCSSDKFLKKIDQNQALSITKLELSHLGLNKIDKNVYLLKNLRELDLSFNNIKKLDKFPILNRLKVLNLTHNNLDEIPVLPKTLKELDVSYNNINELPNKWPFESLSFLHFQGNPVNCEETSIEKFLHIIRLNVILPGSIQCIYPKNFNHKTLNSILSSPLLNSMLGDAPLITEENELEDDSNDFIRDNVEKSEEKIKPDNTIHENLFDINEGSGDGSGDGGIEEIPACVINCSTFKPLEVIQNKTSPLLSVREMFNVFMDDVFGKEEKETTTVAVVSEEPNIFEVKLDESSSVLSKIIESTTSAEVTVGLERASFNSGNEYAYYLIAVLIFLFIIVSVFIAIKRKDSRGKRNRRHDLPENGICEEMKPLGKPKEIIKEDTSLPERIPLMSDENGKKINTNGGANDVALRKQLEDTLTPKPERVTVTAGEIPASVLKTPQLVHRQINSDGEIVTKALDFSLDG